MEFLLTTQFYAEAATTVAILLFLYLWLKWKRGSDTKRKPPQPSGSWPIIGHLRLLKGLPHIASGKLADRYGPIFMIKLGVHRALVVSTPAMAKECLGTHDKVFASRPQTIFVEHLGYKSAMLGLAQYGPYWREVRKITTIELLSNHRLEMLKQGRISDIRSAIKDIHDNCDGSKGESVDMKRWFNDINLNATLRLIAGKSLSEFYRDEEYNRYAKALRDLSELGGVFVPADAIPILRWLDIGGYEKAMRKTEKEIDHVVQGWLDDHKRTRVSEKAEGKQDFMDVMLAIFETGQVKPSKFDADTIIKATCVAMILGGSDTTAVTLTWTLSLLLNNRDALKKAQAELDATVGKERQVNESDLTNLVYLQAILKEAMRLYPALPLLVPREAMADSTVSGYHIPAGTRLFVNVYKIHRDPEVWPDPLRFHPERFLTTHKDYDVRGKNFELLPFGSGRRICPGISFAFLVMQFTLANLIHGFEISTPSDEAVDMTEGLGLSNLKATPLEVILKPRLPDNLYNKPMVIT